MPRLPQPIDPLVQYAMAQWEAYKDRTGWRRSQRGNLCRHWDGENVTIFKRSDGCFGWCVSGADGTTFSPRGYPTESDAMHAAGEDGLYVGQA